MIQRVVQIAEGVLAHLRTMAKVKVPGVSAKRPQSARISGPTLSATDAAVLPVLCQKRKRPELLRIAQELSLEQLLQNIYYFRVHDYSEQMACVVCRHCAAMPAVGRGRRQASAGSRSKQPQQAGDLRSDSGSIFGGGGSTE